MSTTEVEILRAACCVAGLDGVIADSEQHILHKLKEDAGVGEASYQAMLDRAREDPNYFEDVLKTMRKDPHHVMRILIKTARADADITLNERVVLKHLATRMGLEEHELDTLLAER